MGLIGLSASLLLGAGVSTPGQASAATVQEARDLRSAGKKAEARAALVAAIAKLPRSVRPWLYLQQAQWLLDDEPVDKAAVKKALAAARRHEKKLGEKERELFRRRALEAEIRSLTGQAREQAKLFDQLAEKWPDDPDRLAFTAAHRTGPAKLEAERALLLAHPAHPAALALEKAKREGLDLPSSALPRRVERLIRASRMERALAEVQATPPPDKGPVDVALEEVRVEALVRNDKVDEAAEHAIEMAARSDDPRLLEAKAWALGKARRLEEGAAAYALLVERAASAERKAGACFFSAFLRYENDQLDEAAAAFEKCAPLLKGRRLEPEGLWYRALIHLSRDRPEEAVPLLTTLLDEHQGHREVHKHRYWLARALAAAGRKKPANKHLTWLCERAPLTYYGALARRRLGLPPVQGVELPADALARRAAKDRAAERTRLLASLGFDEAARATLKDRRRQGLATLGLAHEIGAPSHAYFRNLRVRPRTQVKGGRLVAHAGWRAAYARPWSALVDEAGAAHGVDPAFVYAIMRTESGFDPAARSRAGARGLLQLMPYTARGLAKELGRPLPAAHDLHRPDVVIPLGVAFLGISTRELGHEALAAAAYNAGPRRVSVWMERNGALEPELFVERIPFRETRDYVKKTAITAAIYRALDGGALELALPEGPVGPPPAEVTWFSPTDNE